MRFKSALALLPFLLFCGLAFLSFTVLKNTDEQSNQTLINKAAPLSDKGFVQSDFTGHTSIINVFASWCVPCRAEHELITTLSQNMPVYGINYKDTESDRNKFLQDLGNPYKKIVSDTAGEIAIDWGVSGLPVTFIINEEGLIVFRHDGPLTQDILDQNMSSFLETPK